MSARLVVVPDSDRVEQWLLDESRRRDFVDLREVCTLAQLVERCAPTRAQAASPLLVRMTIGRLAPVHAVKAFGLAARSADFAASVQELLNHLRGQAVNAQQLDAVGTQVSGSLRSRVKALAALWQAVDEALQKQHLVDGADGWRLAIESMGQHGLPADMQKLESLEIQHVHDVSPLRLALFEALAKACSASAVRFVWRWPGTGYATTDAFIINAVREVEARWQSFDAHVQADFSDGPLAWVGQQAFADDAQPRPAPELTAFCAPSLRAEAQEIAARVRQLVSAGVPPEAIGIAYRDLAEDSERLIEALADQGIAARVRLGVPMTQSPHGRLALSLLQLEDDGFPAEGMAAILESRAVNVLDTEAAAPRQTFAEAGIRDDLVGASSTEGAYAVRLEALAVRSKDAGRRVRLLAAAVAQVRTWCQMLPAEGSTLHLLESWWSVVSRLGLLDPPRPGGTTTPLTALMAVEVERALAREQATAVALGALMVALKSSLQSSSLGLQTMTRRDFARWVKHAAGQINLDVRGPRTGAVWLLDVRDVPGRRFARLFLGGLLDGRFPGRAAPLPLLSEDERGVLNRAAQWPVFRTMVGEGDVRLPARLAEDRLLFHLALSSAASVTLSRARFDDAGRELLASPFKDALARCVEGFREEILHRSSTPSLDDVQNETELRVRAALEALGPALTRQTPADRRGPELGKLLSHEPWFVEAKERSRQESERLRFFSDPEVGSGPFSGRVEGEVLDALQARLAFDAAHPVASHELSQWGTCAFRGLSTMVLGLQGAEKAGEELDSRARGSFWHDALASLVPELSDAGLLGRDDVLVRERIETAVKTAARRTERSASTGHPALWSLAQEWAVAVLYRVLSAPSSRPFGLARPQFTEVLFGDARAPEPLREVRLPAMRAPERDVFLTGRMDRVDVGEGVVGVLDYKSSVQRTLSQDFLRREFQMAFYLKAVRELSPDVVPTGAWLGLSRNELKSIHSVLGKSSVADLLATDEFRRARAQREGLPNLANAVHALLGTLRRGDFGARPLDCAFCELKPVCRISQRQLPEDGL